MVMNDRERGEKGEGYRMVGERLQFLKGWPRKEASSK